MPGNVPGLEFCTGFATSVVYRIAASISISSDAFPSVTLSGNDAPPDSTSTVRKFLPVAAGCGTSAVSVANASCRFFPLDMIQNSALNVVAPAGTTVVAPETPPMRHSIVAVAALPDFLPSTNALT